MKNTLAFIALLALLSGTVTAGEIYLPSNTPTRGSGPNSWPFSTYSAWRYQELLPAKMLGGQPFRIKEVSVAFASGKTGWKASQFQLRIAHTFQTSLSMTFATNLGASPVALIDGPHTFNAVGNQWSPLGITNTNFTYDGSSSLVLEIRYNRGSGTNGGTGWTDPLMERCYTHTGSTNDPYNATTCIVPVPGAMMGMKLRITTVDTQIVGSGTGRIGTNLGLFLISPPDGGLPYQVASSFGTGPLPLGKRQIGLTLDNLMVLTVENKLPMIFQNYTGILDNAGKGKANIAIPAMPALVGVRIHSAFLTLKASAPLGIQSISNTFTFSVTK